MQDVEYLKSMYPRGIRTLQNYVSEACDYFEYKNSPMYDQCPDSLMISRLCDSICDTIIDAEGIDRLNENWGIGISKEKICSAQLNSETSEIQNETVTGGQTETENELRKLCQEDQSVEIQEVCGQECIQWRLVFQKERKDMQAEELMLPQGGWGPRPPYPWSPRPTPPPRPPHPWPPRPTPPPRPPHPWPPRPTLPPPRPPHPWPPRPTPPRPRPPQNRPGGRPLWLRDLVNILLLNEMRDRRCERGICAWEDGQV